VSDSREQTKTAFAKRLSTGKTMIIDGGLSNQLEAQGLNLDTSLWSAALLKQNPQAVIDAHRHYLDAGAECLITASYQASEEGFKAKGIHENEAGQLLKKSITLAESAIDSYVSDQDIDVERPLIAASIGPYGAALADGSEYHGQYDISDTELTAFHAKRLQLLDNTSADILACETIPSFQEAKVLHELLISVTTPAWVSFSCKDGQHLNDGSLIEQAARLFAEHPQVLAIGINCTAPQYINELLGRIRAVVANKALIVYPNSGEKYQASDKSWHGSTSPEAVGETAAGWVASGASIIGGCCRMGPEHIKQMRQICGEKCIL